MKRSPVGGKPSVGHDIAVVVERCKRLQKTLARQATLKQGT